MNWGKGIVGGMIIFMLFILSMCVYMFKVPADEYDHQYYEKGLGFNKDYNREQQVVRDNAQPTVGQTGRHLVVQFKTPATGVINFIRPADKSLDKRLNIRSVEENKAYILLDNIKKGQWQIVLEWKSNNRSYLYQQEIYVQ